MIYMLDLLHKAFPEQTLKTMMTHMLAKLNLVTREEFDIQTKVLQATRARIETLEKYISTCHNPKE